MPAPDPWLELLDDGRVREAGAARSRQRWLRASAEADASLAGMLVDLAERRADVTLATTAGRVHQATVRAVGDDVVALRPPSAGLLLVPLAAVAWVRPVAGALPAGTRAPSGGPRLVELLGRAGERGDQAVLTLAGGTTVAGRVEIATRDGVRIRPEGPPGAAVYVSATSIREAALFRSG